MLFQIAKPCCSKNSARKVCAARSRSGGFQSAKALQTTAAASAGAQRGGEHAGILPETRHSACRWTDGYVSCVSVLCLGEAIVDLFCERPVAVFDEADAFVPHSGGAVANAAVDAAAVARRRRLAAASATMPGATGWRAAAGRGRRPALVRAHAAAFPPRLRSCSWTRRRSRTSSSTATASRRASCRWRDASRRRSPRTTRCCSARTRSLGARERALTLRARDLALAAGQARPVRSQPADAPLARRARGGAPHAATVLRGRRLLKVNREEARAADGRADPAAAAERLVEMGARLVAVTLGPRRRALRGAASADAPGVPRRRGRHDRRGRRRHRRAGRGAVERGLLRARR